MYYMPLTPTRFATAGRSRARMGEHVNAGNAAFVDADYEAALQHYSAAIAAGGSADAYSKRAAAQLQLARYPEAAADATASLKLQPSLKAHWRAGQACFALHQFEAARAAFADAAKLEPSSRELKRWLRKCDAELESAAVAAPSAAPSPPPDVAARPAGPSPAGAAAQPPKSAGGQRRISNP